MGALPDPVRAVVLGQWPCSGHPRGAETPSNHVQQGGNERNEDRPHSSLPQFFLVSHGLCLIRCQREKESAGGGESSSETEQGRVREGGKTREGWSRSSQRERENYILTSLLQELLSALKELVRSLPTLQCGRLLQFSHS